MSTTFSAWRRFASFGLALTMAMMAASGFLGTPAASASPRPSVSGLKISWANDGWYQVQETSRYRQVCGGGRSCTVPSAGTYKVTNHSTSPKQSWNISVKATSAPKPGPFKITSTKNLSNQNTYAVSVTWTRSSNAAGYNVYRDGKYMTSLNKNHPLYFEDSGCCGLTKGWHRYEVVAYNQGGSEFTKMTRSNSLDGLVYIRYR